LSKSDSGEEKDGYREHVEKGRENISDRKQTPITTGAQVAWGQLINFFL
jgi:hypothetical protein